MYKYNSIFFALAQVNAKISYLVVRLTFITVNNCLNLNISILY